MSQRVLLIWALTASLIAVGAIGYSLGKHATRGSADNRAAVSPTELERSTEPGAAAQPVAEYTVPDSMAGIPGEWRSPDTSDLEGYSVLFDPATRQAIVEQCQHNGYQIDDAGRPVELFPEFCSVVLQGYLESLTGDEAVVKRQDNSNVTLALAPAMDGELATLRIEFEHHDIKLIPGSKNDLLQAMEKEPEVIERKRRFFTAMNSRDPNAARDNNDTDQNN